MFFDFLFYRIYKFYSGKEKGAESSAAAIIGGLQAFNFLTIFFIYRHYSRNESISLTAIVLILFAIFQVTTYVRYIYSDKNSAKAIEKRWMERSESFKHWQIILHNIYVFITVVGGFGFAVYAGSGH